MMVKSGLEKILLKFLHAESLFLDLLIYLIKGRIFALNYKFSNKNDHVCAWKDFNSTSCILSTYPKEPVRTEKSSIFNFEHVNEVWISGVLGVKCGYDKVLWSQIHKSRGEHFFCNRIWDLGWFLAGTEIYYLKILKKSFILYGLLQFGKVWLCMGTIIYRWLF